MWIGFLIYGISFSINSFSTLPYGAITYTVAVRVATVCNPFAALSALFVPVESVPCLGVITAIVTVLTGYHILLAAQSPTPFLHQHFMGAALAVSISFVIKMSLQSDLDQMLGNY